MTKKEMFKILKSQSQSPTEYRTKKRLYQRLLPKEKEALSRLNCDAIRISNSKHGMDSRLNTIGEKD